MSLSILIVEDDMPLREALIDTLLLAGYEIHSSDNGKDALNILKNKAIDIVISDIQMDGMDGISLLKQVKNQQPQIPVILMTAFGTIQQAVTALQDGATDYLVKPFEPEVLVSRIAQFDHQPLAHEQGFVAVDPKSREILSLANKVAEKDVTVMVTGESGAGKEVLVQYIHQQSRRKEQPFVAINCAAIPDNMLEAMLFGYQKGAFTGAYKSSAGKFEQAQGGTLLLDEISEMSLGLQAKLLRVLQEREVERLGDSKPIELDVRVMATSNRNMRDEVFTGRFREDLYYRLNVFPIHLPALRERKEDIVPIAETLLKRTADKNNEPSPILDDDAKACLTKHDWPGNVRELDNVMQRALVLQSQNKITEQDIVFETMEKNNPISEINTEEEGEHHNDDLKSQEQKIILDALKETAGSRKYAAEKLGISPRTLRYKLARMREQGIKIPA